MPARESIPVWGNNRPIVWDVAIEGRLDGKSFIQILFVAVETKDVAIDLARAKFQMLEGEFVEIVEVKRAKSVDLNTGEIEIGGRIFFG
jgi:hypothetical protein